MVDKGFWVWAMAYSNHEFEVGALYATEEQAEVGVEEQNASDRAKGFGDNWEVKKMWVHNVA